MNDKQNAVVATTVCGLILVITFLCPWRIESSNELKWSPIYQQPMSYVRSYDVEYGKYSIKPEEGQISYGIMALEAVSLLMAAGFMYWLLADPEDKEEQLKDG